MSKWRKKPIVIEAVEYTGDNIGELWDEFGAGKIYGPVDDQEPYIITLEGNMVITKGDFVIRGVKGEIYPCKPDIFEATYEYVCGTCDDGAALGFGHECAECGRVGAKEGQ